MYALYTKSLLLFELAPVESRGLSTRLRLFSIVCPIFVLSGHPVLFSCNFAQNPTLGVSLLGARCCRLLVFILRALLTPFLSPSLSLFSCFTRT